MNNLCLICKSPTFENSLNLAFNLSFLGSDDQIILPVISDIRVIEKVIRWYGIPLFYDHSWPCRKLDLISLKKLVNNRTRLIYSDFSIKNSLEETLDCSVKKDVPFLMTDSFIERDFEKIRALFNMKNSSNTIVISKDQNNSFYTFFGESFIKYKKMLTLKEDYHANYNDLSLPLNLVSSKKICPANNFFEALKKKFKTSEDSSKNHLSNNISVKERDNDFIIDRCIEFSVSRNQNKNLSCYKMLVPQKPLTQEDAKKIYSHLNCQDISFNSAEPAFNNKYLKKRYALKNMNYKKINSILNNCCILSTN